MNRFSINKENILLKNKFVRLEFSKKIRPIFLNKNNIDIIVPEIYKNKDKGEILAYFRDGNKKIPAIIKKNKNLIFNFDPKETIKFLIYEKYFKKQRPVYSYLPFHYHKIPFRIKINKLMTKLKEKKPEFPSWPVESSVETLRYLISEPKIKWPKNKRYCITLTHDLDTINSFEYIKEIAKIEENFNFSSCWNIVGNYYKIDHGLLSKLKNRGHEIGCHGYNHDNKLTFLDKKEIEKRLKISYNNLKQHKIKGFRSPSLLRTKRLLETLPKFFRYDSSIPDTEIYSPISIANGCCTVFPFMINKLVEIPLTIPQDATLIFLGYKPKEILNIWIKKLNWIKKMGGIAVINTHPEPHYSGNNKMMNIYNEFLEYLSKDKSAWFSLPEKVAEHFCKTKDL